jgi:uncharacterized protein
MYVVEQRQIDAFLDGTRMAVVGASRNPKDFSRTMLEALRDHGCDVVAVNAKAAAAAIEIAGAPCFARVQDITPPVECAYVLLPAAAVGDALRDCAEADVRRVWVQGYLGPQELPEEHHVYCEKQGIELIAGYCPLMFLPKASRLHRIHTVFLRLLGRGPK